MLNQIYFSTNLPILKFNGTFDEWNNLSQKELKYRDELIEKGVKECRSLLGKQKCEEDYFFYEGSIEGFEECKKLDNLKEYENIIGQLYQGKDRELAYSLKGEDEDINFILESYQIYNRNRETDFNKIWRIDGIRTQIEFVYGRLNAYKIVRSLIKEEAHKKGVNLDNIL